MRNAGPASSRTGRRESAVPRAVTERLNRELNAILQMPEVQTIARNDGSVITGGTPEDFHARLKTDLGKFAKLVKAAGIKPAQ